MHPVRTRAESEAAGVTWYRDFFAELRRLGFAEDTNLAVEPWARRGETARYEALAREVLATKPDAVLVFTSRLAIGFRKAGSDVPVVFNGGSALAWGLVDSLARPGGNLTGFSSEDDPSLRGKAVEFLHEIVPTAKTVALLIQRSLWDTRHESTFGAAARSRGLTPVGMLLNDPIGPAEYHRVFSEVGIKGVDLLVVADLEENSTYRRLIVELAAQYQLPACYIHHATRHFGEMVSYGADGSEHPRMMAGYVARILNGEKPADMPVQILEKYRMVINLKTAKALGLTIPPAILDRANEVIE
ncbi:MAG TPA: ABC transporter substrate-binding protein [Vineibacter sp.]|nr:ABC transporter substrate-binding protein [Vineibacter sp.]